MSTATSVYGTSRTWRDVRLESVMRSIADIDSVAGNASPLCHQLTIGLSFGLALPLAIECLAESELTCCYANNQSSYL